MKKDPIDATGTNGSRSFNRDIAEIPLANSDHTIPKNNNALRNNSNQSNLSTLSGKSSNNPFRIKLELQQPTPFTPDNLAEEQEEPDSDFEIDEDELFSDDDDIFINNLDQSFNDLNISTSLNDNKIINEGGVPNLKYDCLTTNELYDRMLLRVEKIKPILDISKDDIILLMQRYNWNEEKLLESWADQREHIIEDVGLSSNNDGTNKFKNNNPFRDNSLQSRENYLCPICYEEKDCTTFKLECNHEFCTDCYQRYIKNKLSDGNIITCMSCSLALKNNDIDIIMGNNDSSNILMNSSIKSFIQKNNKAFKWCPYTDCQCIIHFKDTLYLSEFKRLHCSPFVTCKNSHKFCFSCGFESHSPADCDITNAWVKKTRNESDYLNWVLSNTKECPKCNVNIEKNGGCNHMKCSSCKYEFCWICDGPWAPHGTSYYECTQYKNEKDKDKDSNSSNDDKKLKKFTFYYRIFNEHEMSAKLDWKLGQTVSQNVYQLQEKLGLSWIEGQFLTDSLKVLNEGRTALKWSFAVAYYSDQSHNLTKIFMDNQALLSHAVESLSEMLTEKNPKILMEKKNEFFNKTGYVENRKHALLECGRDLLCKGICKPK
ncbi:hypothetical protein TBLA_0C02810 [Henningerozyma blattae CBS 6284]|uniref:RBR-type E3 ubiquitin transferase n=1 Tax=Henningerozyma blattae (strain ATCC 34711 / CBS 6284 / DSM 70876 / NBRC 10599 / NRRL Y-10934 / UCD 77-7) TaxID=1071380 RepID=I2H135_HENB6|nr:hypothetical protein TBLA_0C02810 [Tetrapisispora blattae CBS 6284]CCH60087.1 hypothetical protein TBLA_0C02810 [Tetrapisispora blattae CBS 6284]